MNKQILTVVCAAVLGIASSGAIAATHSTDVLIRGAKVHTVSARGTLDNADVLVRDGRIAAVGSSGTLQVPAGADVIDAKGQVLTPGLFAGLSHIGIEEISAESSTTDGRVDLKSPTWDQQWRPEFDVTLAFNPRSTLLPVTRIEGLTWTVLAPETGDSIVAGQGAAVTLDGALEAGAKSVLDGSRSLFVQLGSEAEGRSGGSRAAQYMLLDQAIAEAKGQGQPGPGALLHPAGRTALARYLANGRVVFEVERAADILAVIAFAERNHGAVLVGEDLHLDVPAGLDVALAEDRVITEGGRRLPPCPG